MLSLSILLMAAGSMFWKAHVMIKKGRFSTDVSKIEAELRSSRQLALNMGLDWKLEIVSSKNGLEIRSGPIPSELPPRRLKTGPLIVQFQDVEVKKLSLHFSPTGKIAPEGIFSFSSLCKSFHREFSSFELFRQRELPEALGPARPERPPNLH